MAQIEEVPIGDIRPYEKNPRINDGSVGAVANSIKAFGFRAPIIVDGDGIIIAGHTRYKAAKKLGLKRVPVIYARDMTPAQVEAYRIADNSAGSRSTWDEDLLQEILDEIGQGYDLESMGLDTEAYIDTGEFPDDIKDDTPPPAPRSAKTIPGQIYRLGDHVLMCGDATRMEDMRRLVQAGGGDGIDMMMADPPYNVAIEGETEEHLTIENDDQAEDQFRAFLTTALTNAAELLKAGAACYMWYAFWRIREAYDAAEAAGVKVSQNLIWVKNVFVLGHSDYQWRHEPCLYGWREGANRYFISDRTLTTVEEEGIDPDTMTEAQLRDTLRTMLANIPADAIRENKPAASRDHPTMKPVPLIARMVFNSTRVGDRVLDPFAGSGSTMMACEQLGRRCIMMELDPVYCDVIIKRWEAYTGKRVEAIE